MGRSSITANRLRDGVVVWVDDSGQWTEQMSHAAVHEDSAAKTVLTDPRVACDEHLRSEGIIVRRVAGYKLPHCLRITVGDEASCRRVAHTIGQFKGAS